MIGGMTVNNYNYLDPATRTHILQEVNSYRIPLNADPNLVGLKDTYRILTTIDSYRDRVSSIISDVLSFLNELTSSYNKAKANLEFAKASEMNKDTIKILKSADIRESAIYVNTAPQIRIVEDLDNKIQTIKNFLTQLELVYSDIKDKIRNIKKQIDIVTIMGALGEYGNDFHKILTYTSEIRKVRLSNESE